MNSADFVLLSWERSIVDFQDIATFKRFLEDWIGMLHTKKLGNDHDSRGTREEETPAVDIKSSRRPMLPNLKMGKRIFHGGRLH